MIYVWNLPPRISINNLGVEDGNSSLEELMNLERNYIYIYAIEDKTSTSFSCSHTVCFQTQGSIIKAGKRTAITSFSLTDTPISFLKKISAIGRKDFPKSLYDLPPIFIKDCNLQTTRVSKKKQKTTKCLFFYKAVIRMFPINQAPKRF